MALNFKIVLLVGVLGINTAQAYDESALETNEEYLTITSMNVSRVSKDVLNQEVLEDVGTKQLGRHGDVVKLPGMPNKMGVVSLTNVGQVLAVAQGVVALGEGVYTLVQKGKPSIKTSYAPISVLPRNGNEVVDIFETEEWKAPKRYTYQITYTNGFNMDVVKFRYSVIYAYGGKYNGAGAYITAAQIIPESVTTLFGFDFSATLKLGGVMNHGKKADPLAGAILTLQYTVETVLQANVETLNYHITGTGGFKKL
jgi:hypothetical protein